MNTFHRRAIRDYDEIRRMAIETTERDAIMREPQPPEPCNFCAHDDAPAPVDRFAELAQVLGRYWAGTGPVLARLADRVHGAVRRFRAAGRGAGGRTGDAAMSGYSDLTVYESEAERHVVCAELARMLRIVPLTTSPATSDPGRNLLPAPAGVVGESSLEQIA